MKSCRHSDTRMLDESEYLADLPAEVCEFCRMVAAILRRRSTFGTDEPSGETPSEQAEDGR